MSNLLLQQGAIIHKVIYNQCRLNLSRLQQIKLLSDNLCKKFQDMGSDLKKQTKYFFGKLKQDQQENQGIIFLNQFVGDIVKEISNLMSQVSRQININIVDPLTQFISNLETTNNSLYRQSISYLNQIQQNTNTLKAVQKTYKDALGKNKNKKYKSEELLDYQVSYRQQIANHNKLCGSLQQKYKKLILDFELANQSRCVFTKNLQIKLVRILNSILNSDKTEQGVKQYENYPYVNTQIQQKITLKIQCTLNKRSQLLFQPILHQFIQFKNPVQDNKDNMQKRIQDFTTSLISKQTIGHQFQGLRSIIIQDQNYSQIFLKLLASKLKQQVSVITQRYHQLIAIIKFLFATMVQNDTKPKNIYHMLLISLNIKCESGHLIKQLAKNQQYWQNQNIWFQLYYYLKKKKQSKHNNFSSYTNYTFQIISKGLKKIGIPKISFMKTQQKSYQQKNQDDIFEVLRQINLFIAKLELNSQFTFDLLSKFTKIQQLSQACIQKLVKYNYLSRKNDLDKLLFDTHTIKKRRQIRSKQQINRKYSSAIRLILKYLPVNKYLLYLRLVCKQFKIHLTKPIFQRYLKYQKDLFYLEKIRLKLYTEFIPQKYTKYVYQKLILQIPKIHQYQEIIQLDVKRSCNSRPHQQPLLSQLLQVFSFYNKQIGYLQGMNYLGQQILKLKADKNVTYNIFQYILHQYFQQILTFSFDGLKIKIYQFIRLMQKNLPALSKHFYRQKIEGEHFLIPWAITLWGQYDGDLSWILWDGFIVDGWKWWMKVCLWYLKMVEADLLQQSFDQILKFFSESSGSYLLNLKVSELMKNGQDGWHIKQQINDIKVTNWMLKQIQKQYVYYIKKACDIVRS